MIPLVKPYIAPKEEMLPAIESVLYSGYISEGNEVYNFEKEFAKQFHLPNAISVNSGTAALHIAMLLIGIKSGDEVISTALTAEPTNTTIALTGAKIIWADVDPQTGLIDPKSIEKKITNKTKAIVVVHYAGMVCDMEKINVISKKYNIPVVEDAAHALGSKYKDSYIGNNSKYTCFSFQAIKHMTTVDGGMLVINNALEEELEQARRLRWFGLDKNVPRLSNDIIQAGYKYHMNNVNAVIGSIQLKHIGDILDTHIDNGKYFDEKLKNVSGIKIIPYYSNTQPSYWLYTCKVDNREAFIKMMEENNISVSPLHHRSDTHSVFKQSLCDLPALDKFYDEFIHIPCGWWITDKERHRIVETIKHGW